MPTNVSDADQVPRSIERVLDLLEIVLAEPGITLTRAADAADLTPTTALRYLRALEVRGYVERNPDGQFHPGATMQRLAATIERTSPLDALIGLATRHLEALAESTGESVYLVVSDGRTATYVATAESPRAIRHVGWVGQNVSLEGTAAGAALENPGHVVVRTGAVEPDITAVSRALVGGDALRVAISVVGPEARLGEPERSTVATSLSTCVEQLEHELSRSAGLREVAS